MRYYLEVDLCVDFLEDKLWQRQTLKHIFKSNIISTVQLFMENGCTTMKVIVKLHRFLHIMETTLEKNKGMRLYFFSDTTRIFQV